MTRIKKGSYPMLFASAFCAVNLIIVALLVFILEYERIASGGYLYLCGVVVGAIVLVFALINIIYNLCNKTYYEFSEDALAVVSKGNKIWSVEYGQMKTVLYKRARLNFIDKIGAPGMVIVDYKDGDEIKRLTIDISFRQLKMTSLYVKNKVVVAQDTFNQ